MKKRFKYFTLTYNLTRLSLSIESALKNVKTTKNIFSLGDEGLTVHFNIHIDPSKGETSSVDLVDVLTTEISADNSTETETASNPILGDLVIDVQSINIQGTSYTINLYYLLSIS